MLEGVTIEQLRTLRAVVEAGSFSAAARKLGRVQAAVSQSIDRLEAQLGLRLFDRSGRVPRLTQHGQAVALAAAHALARSDGPIDSAGLSDAVQIVLGEHRHEAARGSDDRGVLSPRRWRVVDLATKHTLIRHGLGWGHMPEHVVRDDLRAGRLVGLALEAWGGAALRRSLVLVRRRDVIMGPVAGWAQARLVELCRHNIDPDGARNQAT